MPKEKEKSGKVKGKNKVNETIINLGYLMSRDFDISILDLLLLLIIFPPELL